MNNDAGINNRRLTSDMLLLYRGIMKVSLFKVSVIFEHPEGGPCHWNPSPWKTGLLKDLKRLIFVNEYEFISETEFPVLFGIIAAFRQHIQNHWNQILLRDHANHQTSRKILKFYKHNKTTTTTKIIEFCCGHLWTEIEFSIRHDWIYW